MILVDMPVKVKFIKKWGKQKEGSIKIIPIALAKDIYQMGVFRFADEDELEKVYPNSKVFLKYGLNPLRDSFTRLQMVHILNSLEEKNQKSNQKSK
jgi:hypothetical protein